MLVRGRVGSRSIKLAAAAFALAGCVAARNASAAAFQLANFSASDAQGTNSETTATQPYSTPISAPTDPTATSTVTPFLAALVYKTSESQTSQSLNENVLGNSDVQFTANAGDTYSLFGSSAVTTGDGAFSASLFNKTTQTYVYNYSNKLSGTGTLIADGTGGPTAGTFATAGAYDFALSFGLSSIDTAPTAASDTGSGGITLVSTTPEPASIATVFIGGALLLSRRRGNWSGL